MERSVTVPTAWIGAPAPAGAGIRVLIADDHSVVRLGLRTLLERESDLTVVAEVSDGRELLAQIRRWTPDVVLLDVALPGLGGPTVPAAVVEAARVVVVSELDDNALITRAMVAGALAYLVHGTFELVELAGVVRRAAGGQPYLTPTAAAAVVEYFRRDTRATLHQVLTAREREVMDLVAQGLSNQDVAERLSVSVKTVKNHLNRVFRQLEVTDRRSASVIWLNLPVNSSSAPRAHVGIEGS